MPRIKRVPTGMPTVTDSVGGDREALSAWMRERFELIETAHAERVQLLRTAGEHPSPLFAGQVKRCGMLGIPKSMVAKMLGIAAATVTTHYETDYDLGAAEMIGAIAGNMARIATSVTDPAASKVGLAWLERRGGDEWRPPSQKIELKSDDAPPVIDTSQWTAEDRQQLRLVMERAMERAGAGAEEDGGS